MGHINIELAILFNEIDWALSAGAKRAVEDAKKIIFKPDWKRIFDAESIRESVVAIKSTEESAHLLVRELIPDLQLLLSGPAAPHREALDHAALDGVVEDLAEDGEPAVHGGRSESPLPEG